MFGPIKSNLISFLVLIIGLFLASCANRGLTDNTTISQSGDNKRFHSTKRASLSNIHFKTNKGLVKSKQRQTARYQGAIDVD